MEIDRFYSLDIVLVCGLPGSGKSHFAKRFFKKDNRKRINRKEILRLLYEMTSFGDKWLEKYFNEQDEFLVKHVERKICEHLLQNRRKILIDNTSVSASSRRTYLHIAKQMHKSIGVILLNTPLQKCLSRNQNSDDHIPDTVISNLYAGMDLPKKEEGFKETLIIENY